MGVATDWSPASSLAVTSYDSQANPDNERVEGRLKASLSNLRAEGASVLGTEKQTVLRNVRREAIERAVQALSTLVQASSEDLRHQATVSLGRFRHLAVPALPFVCEALSDNSAEVQSGAAATIIDICASAGRQVEPRVLDAFRDTLLTCDESSLSTYAMLLLRYGTQAQFALQCLLAAFGERPNLGPDTAQMLSKALRNITGHQHQEREEWLEWWSSEQQNLSGEQHPTDAEQARQEDKSGLVDGYLRFCSVIGPGDERRTVPLHTVLCPNCGFPVLPNSVFCGGCHETRVCEYCRTVLKGEKKTCHACGREQPTSLQYFGRFLLNAIGIVAVLTVVGLLMRACGG